MKDLLIVEDDPTLGEGIRLALQAPELRPQLCRSLADAGDLLSRRSFDLLILDINLPDGNGLDLLRALRRESEVPVILLTANDLETDIVAGLELGADDYITKPFSLAVLRARVNTQLRRTAAPRAERVQLDGFTFDFGRMEFSRNGVPVELSKTEQKLLRLLVEHRGQTLTRRPGGPDLDGRGGVCGRKRPLRHSEAAAGQAGRHAVQAPLYQDRVRPGLHMGGELT